MSLAFNAAPVNYDNNNNNNSESSIDRKRNAKNRTVKRRQPQYQINKMKEQMGITGMDDDHDHLADFNQDFNPPEHPRVQSKGGTPPGVTSDPDPIADVPVQPSSKSMFSHGSVPQEAFQNLPSLAGEDYYKQYVPYYDRTNTGTISNDELTQKLDYMIHLLEEQQDLRTGHVTEEVILYSFLGVFIIFVLDSFARAGKYVR